MIVHIDDPDDPRVAAFRDIRERDLVGRQGKLIAEGEVVLRVLASAASRVRVRSVLVSERQAGRLAPLLEALASHAEVMSAPQAVLDGIAGFHLHRGILAVADRPEPLTLDALLDGAEPGAPVLMACGIGNHDNMGGLFRNAAAFGAAGVILDSLCCDPFYRKAIRVSVGAALRTPMVEGVEAEVAIRALKGRGYRVLALSPSAEMRLADVTPGLRMALVVGAEGPGLPYEVMAACEPVGIPMAGGFDSLNVATTAAVALNHFTQHGRGENIRP